MTGSWKVGSKRAGISCEDAPLQGEGSGIISLVSSPRCSLLTGVCGMKAALHG